MFDLTLTTKGPLYIGSRKKLPRKEYIFNTRKCTVAFLDEQRFFNLLIQNNLVEKFENYCMRQGGELYTFLYKECGLSEASVKSAILYEVDASDALDAEHSLKDIDCFMRNAQQQAYVPGSSVKGAIRTALLFDILQRKNESHMDFPRKRRGRKEETYFPEEEYFHTLGLYENRPANAVNSMMRGVRISDSHPIDNSAMMLTLKTDGFTDGRTHAVNLCRECVAPGTDIHFRLTLDQSVLKSRITVQKILNAIEAFDDYQGKTYFQRFSQPQDSVQPIGKPLLTLGGGAGFFSKSLAYPYLREQRGLEWTAEQLGNAFRKHHHERDVGLKISPRTLKYGRYRKKLYAFGVCEVAIQ